MDRGTCDRRKRVMFDVCRPDRLGFDAGDCDRSHHGRTSLSARPSTDHYPLTGLLLLIIALGALLPYPTYSQNVVPIAPPLPPDRVLEPGGGKRFVGLDVGLTLNFHSGAFSLVQDGILCCGFDGGSSVGTMIRLRGEYFPERGEKWGVTGRFSIEGHGAEFESNVQSLPIFGMNDTVEMANFQNMLDVSLSTVDFTGMVTYKIGRIPKSNVDLYASGGLSLSFVTSTQFDKTEHIRGPSGVRYLDGTTEKSFPDLQVDLVNTTHFGITAGTNVRYPINEKLFINWELLGRIPFTKLSPDEDWRMWNILFTAGLSMTL